MSRPPVVTVDGPAGSGKTTLGRELARALGLPLIDTGLFYRGVMVAVVRRGADASDSERLAELARRTAIEVNVDPWAGEADWRLRVDGEAADALGGDPRRAPLLAGLSARPEVRAAVLAGQRRLAVDGAVAVGRDCGTVVFPDARLKLYLEASAETRARRRAAQLAGAGVEVDESELEAEIAGRDAVDAGRAASPLRPAADAHRIDTGTTMIAEMVAHALELCRRAGLLPPAPAGGAPPPSSPGDGEER